MGQRSIFDVMEHDKADQGKTLNIALEDKLCLHVFHLVFFCSSTVFFKLSIAISPVFTAGQNQYFSLSKFISL